MDRLEFIQNLVDQKSHLLTRIKSVISEKAYPFSAQVKRDLNPTESFNHAFDEFLNFKVLLKKSIPELSKDAYSDLLELNNKEFSDIVYRMLLSAIKFKGSINDYELDVSQNKQLTKECRSAVSACIKDISGLMVNSYSQTSKKIISRFKKEDPLGYYEFSSSSENSHYLQVPDVNSVSRVFGDLVSKYNALSRFAFQVQDLVKDHSARSTEIAVHHECGAAVIISKEDADDFKRLTNYFNNNRPTKEMKPYYEALISNAGLEKAKDMVSGFYTLRDNVIDSLNKIASDLKRNQEFGVLADLVKLHKENEKLFSYTLDYNVDCKPVSIAR